MDDKMKACDTDAQLMAAIVAQDPRAVRSMLEVGYDANTPQSPQGLTPLMLAMLAPAALLPPSFILTEAQSRPRGQIISLLLEHGASLDAPWNQNIHFKSTVREMIEKNRDIEPDHFLYSRWAQVFVLLEKDELNKLIGPGIKSSPKGIDG